MPFDDAMVSYVWCLYVTEIWTRIFSDLWMGDVELRMRLFPARGCGVYEIILGGYL